MPSEWRRRRLQLIGLMQRAQTRPNSRKRWHRRQRSCRTSTTAQTEYLALNYLRMQRKPAEEIESEIETKIKIENPGGFWSGTCRRRQRGILGSSDMEIFATSQLLPSLGCALAKYDGQLSSARPPQRQFP